jgi:hypothetical protein
LFSSCSDVEDQLDKDQLDEDNEEQIEENEDEFLEENEDEFLEEDQLEGQVDDNEDLFEDQLEDQVEDNEDQVDDNEDLFEDNEDQVNDEDQLNQDQVDDEDQVEERVNSEDSESDPVFLELRQLNKPSRKQSSLVKKASKKPLKCSSVIALKKKYRQALRRIQARHRNETDQLKSKLNGLRIQLDTILSEIRFGQKVSNETFELVANATTRLNNWVKKVVGTPLYKLWSGWGSEQSVGGAVLAGETDFLVPSSFADFLDAMKIPLSVVSVLGWFMSGLDNRLGSFLSDRYGIHSRFVFKAVLFVPTRLYPDRFLIFQKISPMLDGIKVNKSKRVKWG